MRESKKQQQQKNRQEKDANIEKSVVLKCKEDKTFV